MSPMSIDTAMLPVPHRSPAVIATRRVPADPRPTRHRTDVSDSHSVPSHPVWPDRTIAVSAASPRPAPCTVTDAEPVPPLLCPRPTLIQTMSTEYPSDMLPDRSPAVIATRRVPRAS